MKNKFLTILFPLILLSCNGTESARSIKLGHGLDTSHPVHKAMVFMAEELSRNSKGALTMEIYPNQQLGSERQCLELLQIGSLGMTKVSAAVMENFSPEMRVLGLPYLFRDREHTFKVLDGPIGKELLDGAKKYWLKGLGYYDAGSRSFYTKKEPVMVPEDLTGQKIRV
ncbi:MAG: TRAP transporter substrate-binding protein DctP, partial [Bacteroidota bacterium]